MGYNAMAEQRIYNLKVDSDFKQLIPPLSKDELQQLEKNILRDGCREPLCVWNNTILDGHNRYVICTNKQIPFTIRHIFLKNREEAIAWICANQLGRRNITDETRKYLIGKRYEMEKILGAHNAAGINQHTKHQVRCKMLTEPRFSESACRTRERLGEEYRISDGTVYKYNVYSQTLDLLVKIVPEFVSKILSGELKVSHENIVDISRLSAQDIRRVSQTIISGDTIDLADRLRNILPKRQSSTRKPLFQAPDGSVKDMPVYDPDVEISSLVLTIPSWVSSIDRTRSNANLMDITDNARRKLESELLKLSEAINTMLADVKEII